MYSIKLGYDKALERINSLIDNGHHSESLVTSVFTVEKTIRRTFKQLIVTQGFKRTMADKIVKQSNGLNKLIDNWEIYAPKNRKFSDLIENDDIKIIKEAATMRNKLIHGEKVFSLEICKQETEKVLKSLERIKNCFEKEYAYSGWEIIKEKKRRKNNNASKVK
ncbi:hypothetical protein [Polaribacter sp. KT 15]|uniref:hypothetical protein n=1 Tax=Polaribacter sp. KT 15 TaxID=1896175 RepID=UPI00090A2C12|nr:hypothetical protein [Polaribacter sp. KT 15]SHM83191.1 hypothetical protein SAMN05720268_0826 [Polaribacter sp. KT 15]